MSSQQKKREIVEIIFRRNKQSGVRWQKRINTHRSALFRVHRTAVKGRQLNHGVDHFIYLYIYIYIKYRIYVKYRIIECADAIL